MTRQSDPQISFADLEFLRHGVKLDPLLQAISEFMERHAEPIEIVRRDLERGLKNPATGRNGLSARQVLRSLTLQRVKNWDYRELRERIADGYTLRQFTDFYSRRVPKHDAFNRAFNRLTPGTLRAINDAIVQAALELGLEDGRKLRVDTTVVETDIHHPTDSTLLWDSVRVITRLVGRLDELLPGAVGTFVKRTRSARRRMQEIQRMTPKQRHTQQLRKYRELIRTTGQVVRDARAVLQRTSKVRSIDPLSEGAIQELRKEIERHCGLGERVIDQARRRVLENESVPNEQKIFSIFETHTDLIKRGKVQKPVEFGHKVLLAESAKGLITQYRVLNGNPIDETEVKPTLRRHVKIFGDAPELFSADRGFFSYEIVKECHAAGVGLVCIPQRGGKKTPERQAYEKRRAFKNGQRFRAGIEGRISVLFRGRGMKRCLAEGRERFEMLVGAAVLASNLMVIAGLLAKKKQRHRAAA
ncbi:MAG: ISNCY family transposase [Candidatus Acidiferrales bacterium]